MLLITFNPWVITETTATASWVVEDPFAEGIASVEVAIFKDGDTPVFAPATSGSASLEVPQYDGVVRCVVRATSLVGGASEREDSAGVMNYDAPTAPEGVSFRDLTDSSVVIRWVADVVGPENTGWAIVNKAADGTETVIGAVWRSDREATVVADTRTLHRVVVRGLDAYGNQGPDSPALSFASDPLGPKILLGEWETTGTGARISWDILSDEFLQDVHWVMTAVGAERGPDGTLEAVSREFADTALPSDTATFVGASFEGTVSIVLTATDVQHRTSTATAVQPVYAIAPDKPRLEVVEVGVTFIKVRLVPAPGAAAQTKKAQIRLGNEREIEVEGAPFVATFTDLAPGTRHVFTGRAIGYGNLASRYADPLAISTMADPTPVTGEPPTYNGEPVIPFIASLLTAELREYVLQLNADTRVRLVGPKQIVKAPVGFDVVLDFVRAIGAQFGEAIRREVDDLDAYKASVLIDKTPDPLGKLAIFCELIHFGFIWNEGN